MEIAFLLTHQVQNDISLCFSDRFEILFPLTRRLKIFILAIRYLLLSHNESALNRLNASSLLVMSLEVFDVQDVGVRGEARIFVESSNERLVNRTKKKGVPRAATGQWPLNRKSAAFLFWKSDMSAFNNLA